MNTDYGSIQCPHPPNPLLILGTDASGKNHIANFIAQMLESSGFKVEKRESGFSSAVTNAESSEDKGPLALLKEKVFILTFPINKYILPFLITFLILIDLKKYSPSEKISIVISHTPIRVLTFYLGHIFHREQDIRLPLFLEKALKAILSKTLAKTIVLDIDDSVRKARIAKRTHRGKVDYFDRYMANDGVRSERIENFLVWISIRYLNAVKIDNNDLTDAELEIEIRKAFQKFQKDNVVSNNPK